MKTIVKTFTVELTSEEISLITTALHNEYKALKTTCSESKDETENSYNQIKCFRDLRNSFSSLINVSYMGEDA